MFVRKCADNTLHLRYFNCHHQHAMIVCPNDKRKNTIRIYFYHLLNVIRKIPKFNLYSRKIMSYFDCWCYYRTSIIFILALEFLHMQIRMSVCRKWFLSTVFLPLRQQVAFYLQQHLTDAHKNSHMFVFMLTNITMRIISHILKAYLFLLTVWLNSVFLTSRGISKEILMIINLCCMWPFSRRYSIYIKTTFFYSRFMMVTFQLFCSLFLLKKNWTGFKIFLNVIFQ